MKVVLTADEREILLSDVKLVPRLYQQLQLGGRQGRNWSYNITDEDADEIRELVGDALEYVGFDEYGRPTAKGNCLERLIDKFFAG